MARSPKSTRGTDQAQAPAHASTAPQPPQPVGTYERPARSGMRRGVIILIILCIILILLAVFLFRR